MRKYFFIAAIAACSMTLSMCTSAEDISVSEFSNSGLNLSGFSLSSDINSLAASNGMDSFGSGLDMSLDASLDSTAADQFFQTTFGDDYEGLTSNLSSVSMPEGISFESLNTQYANLQVDFANSKKELKTEVDIPSFDGYSGDSTQIFKSAYGNLADSLKLSSYCLPDDFDVNSMLSSATQKRDAAVSAAKSSSTFQVTKNNLTYGSIFSEAKEGVSMASLHKKIEALGMDDVSDVLTSVNSLVSSADKSNLSKFQSLQASKKKQYNSQQSNLGDFYKKGTSSLPDVSKVASEGKAAAKSKVDTAKEKNMSDIQTKQDKQIMVQKLFD